MDHRKLGQELDLFTIDQDEIGSGLVLWKPKGEIIRHELQNFLRKEIEKLNYQFVSTPHIAKLNLYRTSGHFPYYQDSQFPILKSEEEDDYLLKPMNCPHHIHIFSSNPHSYRNLPIRLAEFGTVYRYEQLGALSGLFRTRCFTQDDAHIFCTPQQILDEIKKCVQLAVKVFEMFKFEYRIRIGTKDASNKYIGSDENWNISENAIKKSLEDLNIQFEENSGDAAFYGPKIDFVIKDSLEREWQLGTVQLDYNLPERFDLKYVDSDGSNQRPVMIHRAILGSFERFIAILLEHFDGNLPIWLSPVQAKVANISEKSRDYALKVHQDLSSHGIRSEVDLSAEKIGNKKLKSMEQKVPYFLVVGENESKNDTVDVNFMWNREGSYSSTEIVNRILNEIKIW